MEIYAGRFGAPSVNLGLASRKAVQQNAERQTTRLDNIRPFQDARGHRSHVQTAGPDDSSAEGRQSRTVQPRMGRDACQYAINSGRRCLGRTLHDSSSKEHRIQRHLGIVQLRPRLQADETIISESGKVGQHLSGEKDQGQAQKSDGGQAASRIRIRIEDYPSRNLSRTLQKLDEARHLRRRRLLQMDSRSIPERTKSRTPLSRTLEDTWPTNLEKHFKRWSQKEILKSRKQTEINVVIKTTTSTTQNREEPVRQSWQTSLFQLFEGPL